MNLSFFLTCNLAEFGAEVSALEEEQLIELEQSLKLYHEALTTDRRYED